MSVMREHLYLTLVDVIIQKNIYNKVERNSHHIHCYHIIIYKTAANMALMESDTSAMN